MTITRHRLLATLALPVGIALLAACGSGDATTTSTATATAATAVTTTATESPTGTSTATGTDAGQTSTATTSTTTSSEQGQVPTAFTALGTEPFWDIQVTGRTLTYSGIDIETKVLEAERTSTQNSATYTGNHAGDAFELVVTVGTCNDGMSDNQYPYTVEWTYDGQTNQGCARI